MSLDHSSKSQFLASLAKGEVRITVWLLKYLFTDFLLYDLR